MSEWKWLEEVWKNSPMLATPENDTRMKLIKCIREMREALKPFAKNAEWTSEDKNDGRACGIGCDTGGAGDPTINGHDYNCPIEQARETLARCAEGKFK